MGVIKDSLLCLQQISPTKLAVLSDRTRDVASLPVYIDTETGVIFIDDYYIGEAAYIAGGSPSAAESANDGYVNFEDRMDTLRRLRDFEKLYTGRAIADLGCGAGSFLKGASRAAKQSAGIELCAKHRAALTAAGVPALKTLNELPFQVDTLFMLHSFEHMPDPMQTLNIVYNHLKTGGGGTIVVEVPHAKDFLIQTVQCRAFIDFTLWSQHLILHTENSLRAFLGNAGFQNISINAVQRYPLSNHMHWLCAGKPGGHKTDLARLDTPETTAAYAKSLQAIGATDTLVAIAQV